MEPLVLGRIFVGCGNRGWIQKEAGRRMRRMEGTKEASHSNELVQSVSCLAVVRTQVLTSFFKVLRVVGDMWFIDLAV
jgi:hypothetical protein